MFGKEEEDRAKTDMWKYIFGFVEMAALKCAVDLGIPDALDRHGRAMSIPDLSSTLNCNPQTLTRLMRFLSNRGIFRANSDPTQYSQTALSRRFVRSGRDDVSMAPILLLEFSPPMLAPWQAMAARVASPDHAPFDAVHSIDLWSYAEANPGHSQLINEAMACSARVTVGAIVEGCLEEVFGGVESVVDVGGGTGTAMRMLVKACPRIRAVNFDQPHVVSVAEECEGVEHVGGDMFEFVPKADAAFLMWVLHDWSDEECIQILKNCREAIPHDKGKVIIVEAVIGKEQTKENDNLRDVGLFLDMAMMAHTTKGKERTVEEWDYVLGEAGFRRHSVRSIAAVQSVIEAFPA